MRRPDAAMRRHPSTGSGHGGDTAIWAGAWLALCAVTAAAQDGPLPAHPRELKYPSLAYEPPDPATHRATLPGGTIPAYVVPDRELPVLSITAIWRGGTACDPPGKKGAVNLLSRMLRAGGTARKTPAEVDAALERIAAQVSFSADLGTGRASLRCLSRHREVALALFAEMLREPRWDEGRLQLEKDRLYESFKGRNDSSEAIEGREYDWLIYGDHPVAAHATRPSIEAIGRDDLAALHRRLVHPSRMILAVGGDWEPAAARDGLAKALAGFPEAAEAPPAVAPVTAPVRTGLYLFRKEKVTQSRVSLGHIGIREDHPDRFAIGVMNFVLGGGSFSSRLTQAIRVDRGLAYSAGSRYSPGEFVPGTFRTFFQSKHATCAEGLRVALAEVRRLREEGPTEEEVAQAKSSMIEGFPSRFPTAAAAASALADLEARGMPADFYRTYRKRIEAVTVADVRRAAKEHLRPEHFVATIVGDIAAAREGAAAGGFGIPG
ncbi:MAG: insulinase family protein, partial [Planctomycetales bacterium]|nr:insulinase family protein [Planctomycetales bacterium]